MIAAAFIASAFAFVIMWASMALNGYQDIAPWAAPSTLAVVR